MLTDTRVAAIKPPTSGQDEHPDQRVTGLRLRVGASGQKAWILRKRVGPKVINKKLGTYPAMSLAKARETAVATLEIIERDGTTDALSRTFGAVAEIWIDKVAKVKNDSWRLQERRLENHVLPIWRDKKIVEIKRADVRDLLDSIDGDVLPNRVLTLVKTIFRYALTRDWIDSSPVEGIAKPNDEIERQRVLDMTEIAQIWRAADLLGYPFGPYLRILMLTAQRRTEVASMRWGDLDLDAATWVLPAERTKSDRAHLVPLSASAISILASLPRMGEFVFTTDGESHVQGYAKAKAKLDDFIAAMGNEIAGWRFHDLRRSAATHMVRLGVQELVVSRVLNHAVQGVTGKVYALHNYAPEKRDALDKWSVEIGRCAESKPEHVRLQSGSSK